MAHRSAGELTDEGFAKSQLGDWDAAIVLYEEAITQDPKYARAYANIGYGLNRVGQYSKAIDYVSRGIECATDDADRHRLYDTCGFAKSNLKDYDGAIDDFSKAIGFNPKNPRVFYHRAEAHASAEHFKAAYSDVLRALELDRGHRGAMRLKMKLEDQHLV